MRLAGVVLILCGAVLNGIGLYLVCIALSWPMPDWLPTDLKIAPQGAELALSGLKDSVVGLAAGLVVVFGGVAGLNGLWMLVPGRRNRLLLAVLMLLFTVFVVAGVWATLENGNRLGQIGG